MIAIETFDSLVDAIYEAGLDPQQWPGALAELAAAAGANVADLLLHDSSRGASVRFSPGMDPAAVDACEEHYCRLDSIRPAVERKPPGTIITDRDIVSKDWLTRTEFYNDWVRPQNFYDCTMLTLFRDPMRAGVICLAAPERADAFVARSSQLLGQWRPHLARAARITLKLAELDALRQAGFAALDRLTEGVVLADVKARVVFANGAAEAMFARADGVRVDASGLCAASSGQTMALRRLIALSASLENPHEAGGSLLLERPSGRRPLSVIIVPMRFETEWCFPGLPVAIIFVADPEQDGAPLEARLRALYGMTRAEATVAGLISKGSGVKGAARTLGIAPSTARTHLHRVFEKTGTRRQAELARLINKFSLARSY
jgi:DNA-binding CsgD family transcriptional regulator